MSITLGTQLEPRHGLMWCLVAVGIVMLLPTFHAVRTAMRRRDLGRWIADVDRIELARIGGFRGATLVDRDAAGGPQEFSLTWATADLRPLIDVLDEEIARRPTLLAEDDLETWREDYLPRD